MEKEMNRKMYLQECKYWLRVYKNNVNNPNFIKKMKELEKIYNV